MTNRWRRLPTWFLLFGRKRFPKILAKWFPLFGCSSNKADLKKLLWSLTTSSPVTTSSAIVSQLFLEICLFLAPHEFRPTRPLTVLPTSNRLSLSSLCSFFQCNSKTMFLDRNEAPCFLERLEDLPAYRQNIIQTSKRLHYGRYIWYMLNIGQRVAQYLLAPSGALVVIMV